MAVGVLEVTEEQAAYSVQRDPETYYTPGRVGYWLCHWRSLLELAVPTAGAIRYGRPSICVPEGMRPSDPMRYVHVRADIERAWGLLGHRWSLPFQMVEWTMAGYELVTIADMLRVTRRGAAIAFEDACEAMAERLGWRG